MAPTAPAARAARRELVLKYLRLVFFPLIALYPYLVAAMAAGRRRVAALRAVKQKDD